jgi:hypothetical protein
MPMAGTSISIVDVLFNVGELESVTFIVNVCVPVVLAFITTDAVLALVGPLILAPAGTTHVYEYGDEPLVAVTDKLTDPPAHTDDELDEAIREMGTATTPQPPDNVGAPQLA